VAATVTPLLTKFSGATYTSDCEAASIGEWSGSPVSDTINNLENAGCLSKKVSNSYLSFVYTLGSSFNFTAAGHTHIYVWMMVTTLGKLETRENGGIRIRVEGATTSDFKEWYVGGKTYGGKPDYAGGWKCFVIDTTKTPDRTGGTVNLNSVPKVGVGFIMSVSVTGNVTNCFWDVMREGSGLLITGGTSGTPGTFQDILDAEDGSTAKYGILRKEGGVLFCSGELIFGDASGITDTYFTDTGQVIIFEDKQVNSELYKIKIQGNATGTTQIKFGTKIGSGESAVGNAGCTFRSANKSATPFQIDCLQSNVGIWGFYACIFQNGGATKFDKISTNTADLISCSWINMNQADVNDSFVRNCTFSGYTSDTIGALKWNSSIDIKRCAFNANTDVTNNPAAIEHPAQGTFTYTDLTFSGNDYDINYTAPASSGVLTILKSGTSNPETSKILNPTGNSVSIEASTTVNITIVNSAGATITANCEVTIVKISDESILFEEDNIVDGTTSYGFTTGGGTATYINVHNVAGYQNRTVYYTLPSSGTVNLEIQLDDERYYSNP